MKKFIVLVGVLVLLGAGCQKINLPTTTEPVNVQNIDDQNTTTTAASASTTPLTQEEIIKAANFKKAQELFNKALRTSITKDKADYRAEIVKLSPDSDLGLFSRAFILTTQKTPDYQGSINLLIKAIKLNPNFTYAYANRGANYFSLGEYDKAIADASVVISLDPKLLVGYSNRAAAYQKRNMFNEAMIDLNKALELSPKSAELYFTRAEVYAALGKMDEAQADLKKFDEFNILSISVEEVKKK